MEIDRAQSGAFPVDEPRPDMMMRSRKRRYCGLQETVTVEDTVVIDDSIIIVDTTEDMVILIDDSVKKFDTVTIQNVVEDCVTIDIDDSSDSSDSYTSDRSRSTKYMSECPIHNHHVDGTCESICLDNSPCNCMYINFWTLEHCSC